jgi:hypothetical protein
MGIVVVVVIAGGHPQVGRGLQLPDDSHNLL